MESGNLAIGDIDAGTGPHEGGVIADEGDVLGSAEDIGEEFHLTDAAVGANLLGASFVGVDVVALHEEVILIGIIVGGSQSVGAAIGEGEDYACSLGAIRENDISTTTEISGRRIIPIAVFGIGITAEKGIWIIRDVAVGGGCTVVDEAFAHDLDEFGLAHRSIVGGEDEESVVDEVSHEGGVGDADGGGVGQGGGRSVAVPVGEVVVCVLGSLDGNLGAGTDAIGVLHGNGSVIGNINLREVNVITGG